MKQDNINYLMVGTFVLTTLLLLLIVLLRMTGKNGDTEPYDVVYNNVAGIQAGSAVTYGGFQIGQVDAIVPVLEQGSTRFKLQLAIDSHWNIPDNSEARIFSPGLLSDPQIDIVEGDSQISLVPGGRLKGKEAADLFGAIDTVAYEVKDLSEKSIRPLLKNLGLRVDSISKRFDVVGNDLTEGIPQIVSSVNTLLGSMNASASRLEKILSTENTTQINSLLVNVNHSSQNLVQLTAGLEQSAGRLDGIIASAGKLVDKNGEGVSDSVKEMHESLSVISKNVDAIIYNINTASRNFNEFSHQIRINPGLLLGTKPLTDNAEAHR